jgi:hypothetical protein
VCGVFTAGAAFQEIVTGFGLGAVFLWKGLAVLVREPGACCIQCSRRRTDRAV